MVAMAAAPEQEQEITLGPRISSNEAEYGEIADFLFDEAALLDGDRHKEWLELTTEDVVYIMPVRRSLYRKEGRGIDYRSGHNEDDRGTLAQRVRHIVE